jgi:hypothetical protein
VEAKTRTKIKYGFALGDIGRENEYCMNIKEVHKPGITMQYNALVAEFACNPVTKQETITAQ